MLLVQPVPEKMRIDIMINETQIEILHGVEILVNCRFKFPKTSV